MNDRDCESCKKFSRNDPHESEGYCDAKRTWVDPQEGEDCKMHEFTLHSANKYKDGSPIMSEPDITNNGSNFCGNCTYFEVVEGIGNCELSGEIVDPDDSSCVMFEPPF